MKKICLDCHEEKDNELFAKDPKHTNGTKNICKTCAAARKRVYYSANRKKICSAVDKYRTENKDKVKETKKKWQQSEKCKEYMKQYNQRPEVRERLQKLQWKRKYGISESDSISLLNSQNYKCAICGVHLSKPYLDHCHATNKIRGFLCTQCNVGLGSFKDNSDYLRSAIEYLNKNGSVV